MAGATFLVSDTHFGHAGVCKFLCEDGIHKIRPWTDPDEMNEDMIRMWNETVRPNDKVYHLGDVVINRRYLPILDRLNGDKVLIKGNHDIFKLEDYAKYFRDIRSCHKMGEYILTHIPLHPDSLARWCGGNFHGHLHTSRVMEYRKSIKMTVIDPRYFNVSVEQIGFKPILFEEAVKAMKYQQE
jgi:calcineurin-like phosphoesterase family protein